MLLRHTYPVDDATVDGRTLDMVLVPINAPRYVIDDDTPYREAFSERAFSHIDATRVELRYTHRPDLLNDVGRGAAGGLRPDGSYWRATMIVAKGTRGDHIIDLVDSGMLGSVSIGFEAGTDRALVDDDGPYTLRAKVKRLEHVALVGGDEQAQYPDARVLARRAAQDARRAELLAWIQQHRRGSL